MNNEKGLFYLNHCYTPINYLPSPLFFRITARQHIKENV